MYVLQLVSELVNLGGFCLLAALTVLNNSTVNRRVQTFSFSILVPTKVLASTIAPMSKKSTVHNVPGWRGPPEHGVS